MSIADRAAVVVPDKRSIHSKLLSHKPVMNSLQQYNAVRGLPGGWGSVHTPSIASLAYSSIGGAGVTFAAEIPFLEMTQSQTGYLQTVPGNVQHREAYDKHHWVVLTRQ